VQDVVGAAAFPGRPLFIIGVSYGAAVTLQALPHLPAVAGVWSEVCFSRQDELVPFAQGKALYDAYAGPKWHWWVGDACHYNVRQKHRAEYLLRLRSFVEDCFARRPDGWQLKLAPCEVPARPRFDPPR
jgi:hypothetical protein